MKVFCQTYKRNIWEIFSRSKSAISRFHIFFFNVYEEKTGILYEKSEKCKGKVFLYAGYRHTTGYCTLLFPKKSSFHIIGVYFLFYGVFYWTVRKTECKAERSGRYDLWTGSGYCRSMKRKNRASLDANREYPEVDRCESSEHPLSDIYRQSCEEYARASCIDHLTGGICCEYPHIS